MIGKASEAMPVAPLVGVAGSNVILRPGANINGLNRPLEVGELHAGRVILHRSHLVAVDSDERETNALNVYVMNLRVNENVVNVEIGLKDILGLKAGIRKKNRGFGDNTVNIGSGIDRNNSSISGGICKSFALKEQISRGGEENLVMGGKLHVNKTLTIRNRHRRNREARIAGEPEEERNPQVKLRLLKLRRLRAVNNRTNLTGGNGIQTATRVGVVKRQCGAAVCLDRSL